MSHPPLLSRAVVRASRGRGSHLCSSHSQLVFALKCAITSPNTVYNEMLLCVLRFSLLKPRQRISYSSGSPGSGGEVSNREVTGIHRRIPCSSLVATLCGDRNALLV